MKKKIVTIILTGILTIDARTTTFKLSSFDNLDLNTYSINGAKV